MVVRLHVMGTSSEWLYSPFDALHRRLRRKHALAYIQQQNEHQQHVQQQMQHKEDSEQEEEVEVCAPVTDTEVRDAMVRIDLLRTALLRALPRRAMRRFDTAVALPIARGAGQEVYDLLLCGANEGVREVRVGLSGRLSVPRLRALLEDCELDWECVDEYMRVPTLTLRRSGGVLRVLLE